eukprot:TRINITY_DN10902_c0_g1_i2.p2 TRINITY_DN10902_c0_g1~~TRINITY_DN10902_c0_g1_i2.p2  ORF type:complete len:107 (+),score=7.72 TRINITY_DN10902_c0_g1_i2:111-431(+)
MCIRDRYQRRVRDKVFVFFDFRVAVTTADQTFNRKQGVFRVGHSLTFRRLTDKALTVIGESDHRRRGTGTFAVLNHAAFFAVHDCDAGVGGAKVDTDNLAHSKFLF